VALCIGASIEFLSGARRRAPRWMQRAGLEWAFRLLSEPRRLWRRYIVEGPRIFVIWYRWRRTFPAR
jgi:exopolysaccharide biosynthesis WecB/TagA/CpsF family protein